LIPWIDTKDELSLEFLGELAQRFQNDGLVNVIGPTITAVSEKIASLKFNENYQPAIDVFFNNSQC
jgi:hypothetical protein